MSQYYGDIQLGDTIEWLFTTVNGSGVPTILTGSPTATAYTDGGVTQSGTGVTLTADFDSVTGLNKMSVVATSGNGFAAGENIEIVLDAGTVDGNTVVGYAVGSFSIENRSNLRPTTVGNNEVDVTATGAVGVDWGNVENQSTSVDLSATDIQLADTTTTVNGLAAGVIDDTSVGTLTNSNFAFVDANERVDVGAWLGTAATSGTGGPDVNVNAIGDSTTAAAQLALSADEIESGAAEGSPSTTVIQTDLAETQDDIYIGRVVIFTSGNARGEATEITDYTGSTGTITVTALANAPSAADTFILL